MLTNLIQSTKLKINKLLGRSFTPHPRENLFIDPTGLCNLACRFCAYPKLLPGHSMDLELFKRTINQATEIGFRKVFLTPMLGDAFMDKTLDKKLEYLESNHLINEYGLYTNFILADVDLVNKLKKLRELSISVYGVNLEDFKLVTKKDQKQFEKFVKNLELLKKAYQAGLVKYKLHFSIRTKVNDDILKLDGDDRVNYVLKNRKGEIIDLLNYFKDSVKITVATVTDTWLGVVKQEDVDVLGYKVSPAGPMAGPCNLIFGSIQIRYNGTVHACTRSVQDKLKIGDLTKNNLKYILSFKNPEYKSLVDSQISEKYSEACIGCAHYRSVYQNFKSGHGTYAAKLKLKDTLKFLSSD
jgi:radical SAM protein with 4Fe4S-binding SPASM domain